MPALMIEHVKKTAKQGDPDDVIRVIDEYCWNVNAAMNIGDEKGAFLDEELKKHNPTVLVELGSYLGYSAVRIARLLKPGSKLYAVEINPDFAKVVQEMVDYAGLTEKVQVIVGSSSEVLKTFATKYKIKKLDFVLFDHVKDLYLPDIKILEQEELLRKGTVLFADNIIFPGAPDYAEYVRKSPRYETKFIESHLEYAPDIEDGVEISICLE